MQRPEDFRHIYTIQKEPVEDVQIIFDTRPYVHFANDSSATKLKSFSNGVNCTSYWSRALQQKMKLEDEARPQEDHVIKLATLAKAAR
jgi:hypothetical protein